MSFLSFCKKTLQYVISCTISSVHPIRRDRNIATKNWWHQINSETGVTWTKVHITRVWGHLMSPKAGGSKLIVGTNSTSSLNETTLPHHITHTSPHLLRHQILFGITLEFFFLHHGPFGKQVIVECCELVPLGITRGLGHSVSAMAGAICAQQRLVAPN